MKRYAIALLFAAAASGALRAFPAVEGLIQRRMPSYADQIVLKDLPAPDRDGPEIFAYESKDGKLILEGNSPVAQASALGHYLRKVAHVTPFWEGFDLHRLPKRLPAVAKRVEQTSPFRKRAYLNYCTLSYSCAFWDWKRWEYEIDLMALQGINMPLMPVGLEGVWYNILQHPEVGFTEAEAREFLVGPAYFAWQWMTNIEGFGGPLPKVFIDAHVRLGQRIMERELAFGMTPIQQGFTGFVPHRMKEKFPAAGIRRQPNWSYSFVGSAQLDPLDPLFRKLARLFYAEQKRLFGAHGYYGTDPFHESAPPRPGNAYLGAVGKAIYDAAAEFDAGATLCMQSWSLRMPILRAIPKEHALVLDIGATWKRMRGFEGYPFIVGRIFSYGGRSRMYGDIRGAAQNPFLEAQRSGCNCVGMGLFPEAIQHNPGMFSMLFEQLWNNGATDVDTWLKDFCLGRYGTYDLNVAKAWQLLLRTVYNEGFTGEGFGSGSLVACRAQLDPRRADPNWDFRTPYRSSDLLAAWEALLEANPVAETASGYRFDVADVGRHVIGDWMMGLHAEVAAAYLDGDAERFKAACDRFIAVGRDMDRLCGAHPLLSFVKWVQDARAMEGSPADKDLYEFNASCLVTQWGHNAASPHLYDYSWREWGGLISDYYLPRWQFLHRELAQSMKDGTRWPDERRLRFMAYSRPTERSAPYFRKIFNWEYDWIYNQKRNYTEPYRPGDTVALARAFLAKWGDEMHRDFVTNPLSRLQAVSERIRKMHVAEMPAGRPFWTWTAGTASDTWKTVDLDVSRKMESNGVYAVSFHYTGGKARLDIEEVQLLQNGAVISTDKHPGTTGLVNRDNLYRLRYDTPALGAKLTLRMKIRSDGYSGDSEGSVFLRHL